MASGDRTNKIAVELHRERCLHVRSVRSQCSLCSDSCPGGAIALGPDHAPVLDASRCMQCGQCLTACPLEVFDSPNFTERQLVNRIEGGGTADGGGIGIFCFLPYGQLESLGRGTRTYQLGTCLAALSPGVLLELCLARSCELDTDHCRRCRLFARLRPTFEANVTAAFRMLHGLRASANLKETTPLFLPRLIEGRRPPAVSPATARANIRALFHGRGRASSVLEGRSPLALRQKSKHVPGWRKRVKELWFQHGLSTSGACDFAWPELVVDPGRCRACGICMQMCPTGAICHSLDDGVFTSSFTPGSCADCGLCLAVCPERALSRDYRAFSHPFLTVDVFSHAADRCARCGMPVLAGPGRRAEGAGEIEEPQVQGEAEAAGEFRAPGETEATEGLRAPGEAEGPLCVPCAATARRPPLAARIRAQLGVVSPGDQEGR